MEEGAPVGEEGHYDPSKDPKRKAKSKDPGWKYGFWPDLSNKDSVQCMLCGKVMYAGIKRLKQHLAGGFGDVQKCTKTTTSIMREMHEYIRKIARNKPLDVDIDNENEQQEDEDSVHEVAGLAAASSVASTGASGSIRSSSLVPSSGTAAKRKQSLLGKISQPAPKQTKSVASVLRKTPEEVVEERHAKGPSQSSIEHCMRTKEEKERVHKHVADFFYECGIPFNAINSRSFEIMVESIGQYGPGYKPPTFHDLRLPLLKNAVIETQKLRERHERAWKEYGCTLMSDGWTDKRGRHLINFLVNSPEGTFFLESIDASAHTADAVLLAGLLESKIEEVGKDKVVQVVTDNGANFKAAGRILMERIPTLFWTPCAAHCLDLMLEDIGKLALFKKHIERAKRVTTFIYRHGKLLDAMREKTGGRDLMRSAATRFATAFLTLQSLYKHRDALRLLFVGDDWTRCKLAYTEAGKNVCDTVLSTSFWSPVEDCIRASQPLLIVLRIVDGDEKPAMPEVAASMDLAKKKINDSFANKPGILKKVMDIINRRWTNQMEQKLYGAALFLNLGKYFEIKEKDVPYASRLRMMFNVVLEKMATDDDDLLVKLSSQSDDYEHMRGGFGMHSAIKLQKSKSPLDWWSAFGGDSMELQSFAKRIISLCCSASGCERNWSTFEFIHTKKRNRLEAKRLNDLVYIQYNRKIANRFRKRRVEGTNFNPLILEEFDWDNEWVNAPTEGVHNGEDDLTWNDVDQAIGASQMLRGRNLPRRARGDDVIAYSRRGGAGGSRVRQESDSDNDNDDEVVPLPADDLDVEDDYGQPQSPPVPSGAGLDEHRSPLDLDLDV